MRSAIFVAAAACLLAGALAECPNACSGHGLCSTSTDHCQCFAGWEANDCSQRTCPYGYAFADSPNGDTNYDGDLSDVVSYSVSAYSFDIWETHAGQEYGIKATTATGATPVNRAATEARKLQNDEGHFWKQCSGRGACDVATGNCQCDEGYEGVACQRQACPGNCNGHGRCMNMREAAVAGGYAYDLWDARKNQVCVCDRGYSGIDCTQRLCPRGDDPIGGAGTNEVQYVDVGCGGGLTPNTVAGFFRLNVTDYYGFTWQTGMVPFFDVDATPASNRWTATEAAGNLTAALQALPNDVMKDAVVTAVDTVSGSAGTRFSITFPTVGDYAAVAIDKFYTYASDTGGCSAFTAVGETNSVNVVGVTTGGTSSELEECSGRGLCDYTTGVCKCFAGYTGVECSQQNALAE